MIHGLNRNILKSFNVNESADKIRLLIMGSIFLMISLMDVFHVFERFELVTYDYRVAMRGARQTDSRIAVIEITDRGMAKIGRWPWSRSWHATLIKALEDLGARAVVFDVLFTELSTPAEDAALSQAIRESKRVYLAEVVEEGDKKTPSKLLESLEPFSGPAKGGGHINIQPDADGVMRRIELIRKVGDKKVPQLAFQAALDNYGTRLDDVRIRPHEIVVPIHGRDEIHIPLDAAGRYFINWTGRWKESFAHFDYVDVVSSYAIRQKGGTPELDLDYFKDKICVVGTTATGLFDIRPTPLEPAYPAVGVNLTVLNNMLEKRFIRGSSHWQDILILLLLVVILFPVLRQKNLYRIAFFTALLALGYGVIAVIVFSFFSLWIPMIYPFALIFLIYFTVTLYNQLSITIERSKLLRLATRDSLTGLYNIGHFKLLLKAEIATVSIRREKKLSLMMSDIDDFKKTNDTYGHLTGDTVLKEVANCIKNTCRALDVAARYGGEEFILMLPGANVEEAYKVADKIRTAISEKIFFHEKGDFTTSISAGVTQISPDDKDVDEVVARADRALYAAKRSGKNKVVIASDTPQVQPGP